jgi:LAO/AO transport system kinase
MGDEVQAIKAGLLEVADIVVVNKGDRPGAQRTASQLRAMRVAVGRAGGGRPAAGRAAAARGDASAGSTPAEAAEITAAPRPRPKEPEVLVTTATTGDGISQLMATLDRHRARGRDASDSPARLARAEAQVWAVLADRLRGELHVPAQRAATVDVMRRVAGHELDPFSAADRLLETFRSG